MIDVINIVLALATIGFGAIAMFWPSYALGALKLRAVDGHYDGYSEIRAASGGAFVGTGALAIAFAPFHAMAWLMLGAHYAGAATGRIMSIALDGAGSRKMWAFFLIEVVFAAWFLGANASVALG